MEIKRKSHSEKNKYKCITKRKNSNANLKGEFLKIE